MKARTILALEKRVHRHARGMLWFAMRLCGDAAQARALTRRAVHVALERSRFLPVPRDLRAWLWTLLFHQFLLSRAKFFAA
jgi:DNA-directed RNA polymerase specialized sigma24 family protein